MAQPRRQGGRARLYAALVAATLAHPGLARAQLPLVGEVQRVQVVTLCLRVGSTEKESKQVTYTPPPGWYIRSHCVDCATRQGNSSFAVYTVPRAWNWLSTAKAHESSKVLLDLAGKSHAAQAQGKFALERDALLREKRRVRSTHHALIVDATARGEGFLRGGGCLELTVTAELVYLGTGFLDGGK